MPNRTKGKVLLLILLLVLLLFVIAALTLARPLGLHSGFSSPRPLTKLTNIAVNSVAKIYFAGGVVPSRIRVRLGNSGEFVNVSRAKADFIEVRRDLFPGEPDQMKWVRGPFYLEIQVSHKGVWGQTNQVEFRGIHLFDERSPNDLEGIGLSLTQGDGGVSVRAITPAEEGSGKTKPLRLDGTTPNEGPPAIETSSSYDYHNESIFIEYTIINEEPQSDKAKKNPGFTPHVSPKNDDHTGGIEISIQDWASVQIGERKAHCLSLKIGKRQLAWTSQPYRVNSAEYDNNKLLPLDLAVRKFEKITVEISYIDGVLIIKTSLHSRPIRRVVDALSNGHSLHRGPLKWAIRSYAPNCLFHRVAVTGIKNSRMPNWASILSELEKDLHTPTK